jgi:hypothetical protein
MLRIMDQKLVLFRHVPTPRAIICVRRGLVPICLGCPVIVCYFVSIALAQYHIDSWTTDNGLPHNRIRAIHQTRDGYLWLPTHDGLVGFDGVHLKIFNRTNTAGLTSNRFSNGVGLSGHSRSRVRHGAVPSGCVLRDPPGGANLLLAQGHAVAHRQRQAVRVFPKTGDASRP